LLNFKIHGNAEFAEMLKCQDEVDDNPLIQEPNASAESVADGKNRTLLDNRMNTTG
jgi:hypothetical protein